MRNTKAKGSQGERELVSFFNMNGWACLRAAGSGSTKYPCPDILAGNGHRRLAIECKVTKDKKKYFSRDEIDQLKIFARMFGAEAWTAVKFAQEPWYFFMLEDLEETSKSFVASSELGTRKGLLKEEIIGI